MSSRSILASLFQNLPRRTLKSTLTCCMLAICIGAQSGPPSSVPSRPRGSGASNPRIKIVIANKGVIVAELFTDKTPKTTAHILALVKRKFYDHLLFHSVVKGFMAVTGDPKSRSIDGAKIAKLSNLEVIEKFGLGGGGSGNSVPLEQGILHSRGTLGLKRNERNVDSGDSQIFFNLQDNGTNNFAYCAFGYVVEGLDVMQSISQGDRITSIRVIPSAVPAYQQPPTHK